MALYLASNLMCLSASFQNYNVLLVLRPVIFIPSSSAFVKTAILGLCCRSICLLHSGSSGPCIRLPMSRDSSRCRLLISKMIWPWLSVTFTARTHHPSLHVPWACQTCPVRPLHVFLGAQKTTLASTIDCAATSSASFPSWPSMHPLY